MLHHSSFQNNITLFHAPPNFFLQHFKTREIEILSCEHSIKLSNFFFKGVVGGKIFTYLECSITPLYKKIFEFSKSAHIVFRGIFKKQNRKFKLGTLY